MNNEKDILNNLPKFYVGQKVVYITGINMPKGSVHTVTEVFEKQCGCFVIGINGVSIRPIHRPGHNVYCGDCNKEFSAPIVYENNWNPESFRPLQSRSFPLITLSKVIEEQHELVSSN